MNEHTTAPHHNIFKIRSALLVLVICIGLASLFKIPPLTNFFPTIRSYLPFNRLAPRIGAATMVYSTKPVPTNGEPKLSAKEEREWNHMADGMEYYHTHFRHSFDSIYEVSRPAVLFLPE